VRVSRHQWLRVAAHTRSRRPNTEDLGGVVLGDAAVEQESSGRARAEAATARCIPGAVAHRRAEVAQFVTRTSSHAEGSELFAGILRNAHAKLIGDECLTPEGAAPACDAAGNPQITGEQMVQIVRNESVAGVAPIVLEVETVGPLEVART
jgi:hypothetical protein